jgi:hypothetical protein
VVGVLEWPVGGESSADAIDVMRRKLLPADEHAARILSVRLPAESRDSAAADLTQLRIDLEELFLQFLGKAA